MNSPWVKLALALLAIMSTILAFFYYRKSRKEKLPRYDMRSNALVRELKSSFPSLQVLYGGQQVQNLTVTRVILWNAGRETIRDDDVPKNAPIMILPITGSSILDAKITQNNNEPSNFKLAPDASGYRFTFEYMDKNHGIVAQVIHTGKDGNDLRIDGTIKEAGKFVLKKLIIYDPYQRKMRKLFGTLMFAIFALAVGTSLLRHTVIDLSNLALWLMAVVFGVFLMVGYRRVPHGLETFEEGF